MRKFLALAAVALGGLAAAAVIGSNGSRPTTSSTLPVSQPSRIYAEHAAVAATGSLSLTVVSDSVSTLTVSWTPPAGIVGYEFKVDGARLSNTWNTAQSTATFKKLPAPPAHVYAVVPLVEGIAGSVIYPAPPPPPTTTSPTTTIAGGPPAYGFFAASSFWKQPIPTGATVDPSSGSWTAALKSQPIYMNHSIWTSTLFHANASTPRVMFLIQNSGKHITIPALPSWAPAPDADGGVAIVDDSNGCAYETGKFSYANKTVHAVRVENVWTSTGAHVADAGVSGGELATLGGLITPADIAAGTIRHALRFSSNFNSPAFVNPGTRSDGTHAGGIPQGALAQLDPTLDLSQFGLNPVQMMVARALQTYGAYDSDSGAVAFTVYFESTYDGSSYANSTWQLPLALTARLRFLKPITTGDPKDTNTVPGCASPQ